MPELTMGSLFDGIGGFPLAAVRNGITPLWASEIEPFPIEVTKTHFPDMTHVGDCSLRTEIFLKLSFISSVFRSAAGHSFSKLKSIIARAEKDTAIPAKIKINPAIKAFLLLFILLHLS